MLNGKLSWSFQNTIKYTQVINSLQIYQLTPNLSLSHESINSAQDINSLIYQLSQFTPNQSILPFKCNYHKNYSIPTINSNNNNQHKDYLIKTIELYTNSKQSIKSKM